MRIIKKLAFLERELLDLLFLYENKDHLINRLKSLTDKQKQTVISHFKQYPHKEKMIDWNRHDLEWEDFKLVIDDESKSKVSRNVKKQGIKGLNSNDYEVVYDEYPMLVVVPKTYEASKHIASSHIGGVEGKWCTAYQKDKLYWNQYIYLKNGVLLYAIDFEKEDKKAMWLSSDNSKKEYYDRDDDEIVVSDYAAFITRQSRRDVWHGDITKAFDLVNQLGLKAIKIRKTFEPLVISKGDSFRGDWYDDGTWKDGTWIDGTWNGGLWEDGIWEDGIWRFGTWEKGLWRSGSWRDGTWKDGTWKFGIWNDGTWEKGTWKYGYWMAGIWENGLWLDGTWNGGLWEDGIWRVGTWEKGTWKDGTWNDGTWEKGTWKYGYWMAGTWNGGLWEDGIWKDGIWRRGYWKNGVWEEGIWKDGIWGFGTWKGGTWESGTWESGVWKGGTWESGVWEDGLWEKGLIFSTKFKTFISSSVNPADFYKLEQTSETKEQLEGLVK